MPKSAMVRYAVVFGAVIQGGCAGMLYSGDGKLQDSGPLAAYHRYILNLGPLDLTATGVKIYKLSGLPDTELTVGLDILAQEKPTRHLYDAKPLQAVVAIEMTDERGRTIISTSQSLRDWIWSGFVTEPERSFLYCSGAHVTVPVREGVTTDVRVDEWADGGWGTYFKPRRDGGYVLKVSVLQPDLSASHYQVHVQAVGGGWK